MPHTLLPRRLDRRARPRRGGRRRGDAPARRASPTARSCSNPTNAELARGGRLAGRPRADATSTSSSSAPGRPGCRPRCTARRRASARWSSTRAASAARPLELADPQLPRVPARRQRPPARPAGVRAGVGVRRELRVHADASPASRATATGSSSTLSDGGPVRTRAVLLATGASYRRLGVPRARGAERRRRLLRRPHVGGAGRGRPRRLHRRRRQLGRARPRSTSPATRGRSRSWCAPSRSRAGMSDYLVRQVEATPTTSRCGSAPRSSAAAATAGSSTSCCATAPTAHERDRRRPTRCSS